MSNEGKWNQGEVEVVHVRGSGPGGQNRNKRWTGVRLTHLPTGLVVLATERRSQAQNLKVAFERLAKKLEKLFHRPAPRLPTKRTSGSDERRLSVKKLQSKTKTLRRLKNMGSKGDWD